MKFTIDRIATQYERDWSAGNRSFESFLNQVSPDEQRELIKWLIETDIEQAMTNGISVCTSDYDRFGKEYVSHAANFIESSRLSGMLEPKVVLEQSSQTREPLESESFEQECPERIGSYRILNLLAIHGQGMVYRADHPHLNRQVVIKVSKNHLDEMNQRAVLEEGRALAALSHPNLAQVYDLRFQDNCPYLVMEYIEGRNLAERIKDTQLPPEDAADLIATLAEAIQHAHDLGIVHQDLKPANIVIRAVDNTPKIIDFGLASTRTAYDEDDSLSTSYGGTIAYMAPEQAQQLLSGQTIKTVDERVDVFALGAILYQLITGRRLYSFDNLTDGLQQAAKCEFDATFPDNVPTDLRDICLKALAREPVERWRSAADLAVAIRELDTPKPHLLRVPVFVAAALGGLLLCFVGWFLFDRFSRPKGEIGSVPSAESARSKVESGAPNTNVIQPGSTSLLPGATFTHVANKNNTGYHARLFENGPVREGDHLRVEFQFQEAVYCFLFAINPNGDTQLCYPYPASGTYEESLDEVQVAPVLNLKYPVNKDEGFEFSDGAGQQTFILIRSNQPLPSFREWSASANNLAEALKASGYWLYTDGSVRAWGKLDEVRGAPTKLRGVAPFEKAMNSIQSVHPACSVSGLSFPVASE